MKRLVTSITFAAMVLIPATASAQLWGESLNESPLTPIPEQMTLEEYKNMNRRLSVGLALRVIPVPGIMHYYAGEPETGKRLWRRSLLGVAAIIAGAAMSDSDGNDFPTSDFDVLILNAGNKKRERRYEQIPVEIEDGNTQYRLREIDRKGDFMPGGPLIIAGVATIAYGLIYDFYKGIRLIEDKRDRVRHKYGAQLGMQMSALSGPRVAPGVALTYSF
ncbi:MAG: hypothetical protein HOM68_23155 [Gemmatimonadetes bacterium]|jgi:hypothetical protein|nr:hypothetical protein [Gemmatimonadota bacterium]MBT5146813.1 hypothetical protein [Gemmatimonadota bacterium]MBT5590102.1 hypothetical protein [Gemmatimonadota bacterium]MBT5961703.1 hypothetical protein [Gemmatimonadota bacterium]MBT6631208.1 hypothetical protein [Gemmatimonadota bacterium]